MTTDRWKESCKKSSKMPQEQAATRYWHLNRSIKRSWRANKKAWLDKKGEEAQKAADENDSKTLYKYKETIVIVHKDNSHSIKTVVTKYKKIRVDVQRDNSHSTKR